MERRRDAAGNADSSSEQIRTGSPEGTGTDRETVPPPREVEVKKPAEAGDDIVHEASDASFPASDPPAWIDVWL